MYIIDMMFVYQVWCSIYYSDVIEHFGVKFGAFPLIRANVLHIMRRYTKVLERKVIGKYLHAYAIHFIGMKRAETKYFENHWKVINKKWVIRGECGHVLVAAVVVLVLGFVCFKYLFFADKHLTHLNSHTHHTCTYI